MTSSKVPGESIALLIDADNAPANKIEFIIAELARFGVVNIRRAYGNWTKSELGGWQKMLHEYAIQPVQQFDLVKGKNSTDMALVIEAMDILYTKNVGVFAIVSSDSDFAPLILRLRAEGKQVIGFGGKKTPEPFVNSCTLFLILDEDKKAAASRTDKDANAKTLKGNTKLMEMLRAAIRAHEHGDEGWAPLGPVGAHISNQGPFDSRNFGFAKLSELLRAIDTFEVRKGVGDEQILVRIRPKGGKRITPKTPQPPGNAASPSGGSTDGNGAEFYEVDDDIPF